ncbi:hypothetical protein [Amycolatopsis sp. NPDC004625]|uniref:hypothetical protein n=1 Tax=Amycolatopsis sp. NPDC004625 TaxID=3154670 RepID=UPI00339EC6B9
MSNEDGTASIGRQAPELFAKLPQWIMLSGATPQAQMLFTILHARVNKRRGDQLVWCSLSSCAEIMGFSSRQKVTRYKKELKELGAIDVIERPGQTDHVIVHETPPPGYTGFVTLEEFDADRKRRLEAERAAKEAERMGISMQARTPQGSTTRTPQGSRTRRTQPEESCTSSGGIRVAARASSCHGKKLISSEALKGKTASQMAKTLVSVWSAVVLEEGGYLPATDMEAWGHDGGPGYRSQHPAGHQIKEILDDNLERLDDEVFLAGLLDEVRDHARRWAAAQRSAA